MPIYTSLRRAAIAAVLALAVLASSSAGPARAQAHRATSAISVVDDHGARVVLAKTPQRIIALAPNVVEILYALGLGSRVVGVSADSDYPAAATHKPVVLSYPAGANLEKIIALHPDLLIAAGIDAAYMPKLRSLRLPTIVLDPSTIAGILHDIVIAGTATGRAAAAETLARSLQARIDAVARRMRHVTTHPTVYYEIDYGKTGGYTYGAGSFGDALITMAGGANLGRSGAGAYPLLSPEKIIGLNPQVIVLGNAAYGVTARSVRARPGFSAITAVRAGHIYPFDDSLVSRPGPRIVDGLEGLARLLHPEAFR